MSDDTPSPPFIIILMLAYNGVTQPDFWKEWRENSSYKKQVVFQVHSPENPTYGKEFCNDNSIGFYNEDTDWCDANLVFVFIQCLEKIIEKFNDKIDNGVVYFVSGWDIPICPCDAFLGLIPYNRDNIKLPDPTSSKICALGSNYYGDQKEQQWMGLNLKDARALCTIMIKDGIYNELKKKWLIRLRQAKSYVDCPDNYFVSTAILSNRDKWLSAGGLNTTFKSIQNGYTNCIVADPRSNIVGESPIEWNDNDKHVVYMQIGNKCIRADVIFVILYYRLSDTVNSGFFFRKIGPNVDLSKLRPLLFSNLSQIKGLDSKNPVLSLIHRLFTALYPPIMEEVTEKIENEYITKKVSSYKNIEINVECISPLVNRSSSFSKRSEIITIYSMPNSDKDDEIILIFDNAKRDSKK